jgi:hypothetical protein
VRGSPAGPRPTARRPPCTSAGAERAQPRRAGRAQAARCPRALRRELPEPAPPGPLAARRSTSRLPAPAPAPAPRAAAAAAAAAAAGEGGSRRERAAGRAQSPSRAPASELRPRREEPSGGPGSRAAPPARLAAAAPPHPSRGGERAPFLRRASASCFPCAEAVTTWAAKCEGSGRRGPGRRDPPWLRRPSS